MKKPYHVKYDPITQSIKIVDSMRVIQELKKTAEMDIQFLLDSIERMNKN
jgi:hypothetical protein